MASFARRFRTPKSRSQTRPQKRLRRFATERLEDRRLLTAQLSDLQVAALQAGVEEVETFAERLDTSELLSTTVPLTHQTVGDLVNLDGVLRESLTGPISQYLQQDANPTDTGLAQVVTDQLSSLASAVGSLVVDPPSLSELGFTLDLTFDRSVLLELDLVDQIPGDFVDIDGTLALAVDFEIDVKATLGVDLTASSAADAFFVSFDTAVGENQVSANLQVAPSPLNARIGLLETTLGPSLEPEDGLDLNLVMNLDVDGGNRLAISELASSAIGSLVSFDTAGSDFSLQLPINAQLNGLPTGTGNDRALFIVEDPDLFDGTFDLSDPSYLRLENAESLADFRQLTSVGLFTALEQVQEVFANFTDSPAFDVAIPFTGGKTIDEVIGIREAFGTQLVQPLGDMSDGGGVTFESIQEFVDRIAEGITYVPADPMAGTPAELLVDVQFAHFFDVASFPLDLGDGLGDLNSFDIDLSTQIEVGAHLEANLQLGVLLERPGASFSFDDTTPVSALNRGMGIMTEPGADLRLTLRDGTQHEIDLSAAVSVGDVVAALEAPFAGMLTVEYATQFDPASRQSYNSGLLLTDHTTGNANSSFRIERVGDSLAGVVLKLTGENPDGVIGSGQLHGRTFADNLFVSPIAGEPMVAGTVQLIADEIDAFANLGFINIGMQDGEAVGQLTAEFTPGDPGTVDDMGAVSFDNRVTINEMFELITAAETKLVASAKPELDALYSGTGASSLVVEITEPGPGGSPEVSTVTFPFGVAGTTDQPMPIRVLTAVMNKLATSTDTDPQRVKIGHSGGKLTVTLTDGHAHQVRVVGGSPGSKVARLGFTEDVTGYVAKPKLSGAADFDLPVDVDLQALNIPGISLPDFPSLNFSIPDLSLPEFTLPSFSFDIFPDFDLSAFNLPGFEFPELGLPDFDLPEFNFDFDFLGDLFDLKSLEFDSLLGAFRGILDFLRSLEGLIDFDFPLNFNLPMLDISFGDLLDFGDLFADLFFELEVNPVAGLGQFEEILEDVSQIPENADQPGAHLPGFVVYSIPQLNVGRTWDVDIDADGTPDVFGVDLADPDLYSANPVPGYDELVDLLKSDLVQGDHPNVELSLDKTTFTGAGGVPLPALRIDYTVDIGQSAGFGVDPLSEQVPLGLDLAALGDSALTDLIDLRGRGADWCRGDGPDRLRNWR